MGHRDRQLADGMHPNEQGVATIVARISPIITEKLVD
jgi:lysophospholipase L1-like esterase